MRVLSFNQLAQLAEKRYVRCLELETRGMTAAEADLVAWARSANEAYLQQLGMSRRTRALLVSAEWRRTVGPR